MKRFLHTIIVLVFLLAAGFTVFYFEGSKNFGLYVGLFGGLFLGIMIMSILHECAHDWIFPQKKEK